MSGTTLPPPGSPAPAEPFHSGKARAPETGRSIANALAELQRRRSGEVLQQQQLNPQPLQAGHQALNPALQGYTAPPQLPPPDAQMPLPGQEIPPQPDDVAGLVVQVEVDGQLVPVTVDELRRGYLREQDYRRKSQQASTELRRAQEAQQQFGLARQAIEQRMQGYTAPLQAEFAQPIDWEKLSREDPIGSVQKIARLLSAQQAMAEQTQLQQIRAQEDVQRKNQMMAAGHEVLCRVIPGWADPATRTAIQQAIAQHAVTLGYPAEQVTNAEVLDPREIYMAWKSMNYDRLMAQRVQPEPVGARALGGNGVYRGTVQSRTLDELQSRFDQSKKLNDAVEVMRARRAANGAAALPIPPQRLR